MTTSKFEYPIFPDRVYSIRTDLVTYKVSGSLLISLYLDHVATLIPSDSETDDEYNRLF